MPTPRACITDTLNRKEKGKMYQIFCRSNVSQMVRSLPGEQIQHLTHVKHYVDIMTELIFRAGAYRETITLGEYKRFGKAAFYHDIGKAWVPEEVLSKPDQLTIEEMSLMRKHTLFAEELFKLIWNGSVSGIPTELIQLAHDSAVYHHEWWNGNGYPYGISCEQIPLIARITSVCDVYDAITSDRSYRKAHSHEYACGEIEANAGTQFDPALAKLFLENESKLLVRSGSESD